MAPKREQIDVLLRIRRRQEDLKAQAHASAQRDVHRAEGEQAMIVDEQRRMLEEMVQATNEALDVHDAVRYRHHERYLARLSVEKDVAIGELRKTAEGKREDLEGAMKHRKMVERLVERREDVRQHQQRKNEQKATDEIAATKAAVKRMKGQGA
jgi:flagellar export protein FliJ